MTLNTDQLDFIVPPNLISAACFAIELIETNVCLSVDLKSRIMMI